MPDPIGVVVLQLLVEVIKQPEAQGFIETIKNVVGGKNLVIVGPARVGKTTFAEYLRRGTLEDEDAFKPRTTEVEESASFAVGKGKNQTVLLRVRSEVDVPGHHTPVEQVKIIGENRPEAIVIMSDLSRPYDGVDGFSAWLRDFCDRFIYSLQQHPELGEHLRCMLIILNKKDRFPHDVTARQAAVRSILNDRLRAAWNPHKVDEIKILPCISVTNPEHSKPIEAVIRQLAYCLE